MKQHITLKQLYEVNDSQRSVLRKWMIEREYPLTFSERSDNPNFLWSGTVSYEGWPLLSIGQMIEFLDEERTEERKNYWGVAKIDEEDIWYIGEDGVDELSRASLDGKFESRDLCDALWEALKEVLESKE